MKKKIYIAKRISSTAGSDVILPVSKNLTVEKIHSLYTQKILEKDLYIYNGHWILRPPTSENSFVKNTLPQDLTPHHIWLMVKEKIQSSVMFFEVVNSKSYGVIAEAGYACGLGTMPVYLLPDPDILNEEIQDLWFVFQIMQSTQHFWSDSDFLLLDEFKAVGVSSTQSYVQYIQNIIPNFMK